MGFDKAKELFQNADSWTKEQELDEKVAHEKTCFYQGLAELADGFAKLTKLLNER